MIIVLDIIKVMVPAAAAFAVGIALTPFISHYLYKYRAWKKQSVRTAVDGSTATISQKLHRDEAKHTPRMGGIVIWGSAVLTIAGIWSLAQIFPDSIFAKLDFLSRSQTWIPLFTLVAGGLVGLLDDLYEIRGTISHAAGGFSLKKRLLIITAIGLFVGWWFFDKLEISAIGIPLYGPVEIGIWFIPLFVLVMLALYAGGVIDGIDGLSGGVFATIFAAYAGIAFWQSQLDLAAFAALLVGAILAFLWFNIPPARFYMSETGSMALTITLAVVAVMTDTLGGGTGLAVLPIIAFLLFLSGGSSLLQVLSKRFRNGKRVFAVAPLHHHFEAIGWPSYKVVMRYWVVSVMLAIVGFSIALIG